VPRARVRHLDYVEAILSRNNNSFGWSQHEEKLHLSGALEGYWGRGHLNYPIFFAKSAARRFVYRFSICKS
jgi:hypothetical protein